MKHKTKAFTLVELLAVIIILAIVLAIAVPTISGLIGTATRGAFESDAKLLIKAVDYKQLTDANFNVEELKKNPDTGVDTVASLLNMPTTNYNEIAFYKDEFGKTNVFIIGQNKWDKLVAYGTLLNMAVDNSENYTGGYVCAGTVGNAKPTEVLSGKGFTNDSGIQTGTMPNKTGDIPAQGFSSDGTTLKFKPQEGYYSGDTNNNLTYTDPNFIASNIKEGVTIFGLTGSIPDIKTEVAAQDVSIDGTTIKLRPQAGYYSGIAGNNVTYTDPNFVASNIKSGTSIFGLAGSIPDKTGDVIAQSVSVTGATLKLRPEEGYYSGSTSNNLTYTDPNFIASNIKSGTSIFGLVGSIPDRSGEVTALGVGRTGTTIKLRPQEGYYSGIAGNSVNYTEPNLIAGNIKSGTSIFGVAGSIPDKTGDVSAQSASVSGTTIKLRPQEGYYSGIAGNNVTYTDPNLVSGNIKQGATILGVTGTLPTGKRYASGTTGVLSYSSSAVINVGFPCRFISVELNRSHNNSTIGYYDNYYGIMRYAQTNYGTAYIFPYITYTVGATSFTITTSTYDYSSPSTVFWFAQEF